MKKVTLIGAGLVGTTMAILLARKGYQVELLEKRKDIRTVSTSEGRSINLALSHRGWKAIKALGLEDKISRRAIPMYGRMVHLENKEIFFQPYGKSRGHVLISYYPLILYQY